MNVLHRSVGTTGAKQTFKMAAMLVSGRSLATRKGRCFHFRQKSGSVRITGPDRLWTLDIRMESTAWDRQCGPEDDLVRR